MAQARPLQLRVRVASASDRFRPASAAVLSPPARAETLLAIVTLFFLAADLPSTWFRNIEAEAGGVAETGSSLALVVFLTLYSLCFTRLLNNGDLVLDLLRHELALPAFIGWILLSSIWSDDPAFTFRRSLPLLLTTMFGIFLVIRFTLPQIIGISAAAFLPATVLSYAFILGIPASGVSAGGWIGIALNKNILGRHEALAALVYLVASVALPRWRLPLLLAVVASFGLVVGSTSATSLVGLVALLGNFAVFRFFRARDTLFGAVTVSFISMAVAAAFVTFTNLEFLARLLGKDATFTGRTALWEYGLDAIWDRPLLGWGWDAYWRGYFSPAHEAWVAFPWKPPHAHNALLDYILVIGFPGAILFLVMFIRGVVRSARFIRDNPTMIGLYPIMILTYAFVFSLTEAGVVGRHERWVLTVVSLLTVSTSLGSSRTSENGTGQDGDEKAKPAPASELVLSTPSQTSLMGAEG